MEGLAASGVTNTYGSGSDQNTKHYYEGAMKAPNKKKKVKTKGK